MFNSSYVMFIGLNPSTADETKDDPTIRRCVGFAKEWGYGAVCMANLFAYRATDPRVMKEAADPVGPDNDVWLERYAKDASLVVAAWGAYGEHQGRAKEVLKKVEGVVCLGMTKGGYPRHPLYMLKTSRPQIYALKAS